MELVVCMLVVCLTQQNFAAPQADLAHKVAGSVVPPGVDPALYQLILQNLAQNLQTLPNRGSGGDGLRAALDQGLADLGLGLLQAAPPGNTAISPASVAAVLAVLLAGASGQTKLQLQQLFNIEHIPHKDAELHNTLGALFGELAASGNADLRAVYGTALFVRSGQPLAPGFLRFATQQYHSEVHTLDFANDPSGSTRFINKWVSNKTEGQIPQLLEETVEPGTSLVVANAVYFRALWEQPFMEKYTKMQKFRVSNSESLQVPLMVTAMTVPYSIVRGSHAVVGLPYRGGQTVLYLLLPENGDPAAFLDSLTAEKLQSYLNQTAVVQTIVAVPRMRVEGRLELSGPLSALGAGSLFSGADLSGMGPGERRVDELLHRVTLEITETGTVGAAASAANILRDGTTPVFRADRPFLFFVQHRPTRVIIFSGAVYRPTPILKPSI